MANLKDLIVNGVSRFLSPILGTNGKFTDSVTIDGNTTVGGNLTISGTTTLSADPTENMEAATKYYVDGKVSGSVGNRKVFYGTCSTAAAAKTVTCSDFTSNDLVDGVTVIVKFTVANTGSTSSLTLDVNSTGAKGVRKNYYASSSTNGLRPLSYIAEISANSVIPFIYNGEYWVVAGVDVNTQTLNQSYDAGQYTAGEGTYPVSQLSLIMQRPNGTWEKITSTSTQQSVGTGKTRNTHGFILNQIKYYGGSVVEVSAGTLIASNTCYSKHSSINFRYSSKWGSTPSVTAGQFVYLVGTLGTDGLFYLDSTWYNTSLPSTNDGKLYIQIGLVLTSSSPNISFLDSRPIFYHDGKQVRQFFTSSDMLIQDTSISSIDGTIGTNVAYIYSSNTPIVMNLGFSKGIPIGQTCTIHVYNCGSSEAAGTYSNSDGFVCIQNTIDAGSHSNGSSTSNYVWVNGTKKHGGTMSVNPPDAYFKVSDGGMLTITVFYSEFIVSGTPQYRTIINVNMEAEASSPV